MNSNFNRRQFKRIQLNTSIKTSIQLITLSFKSDLKIPEDNTIYVIDLSAGGLKFLSGNEFMVNYLAIFKIELEMNAKNLIFFGRIIRRRKLAPNLYEYGFKFDFNPENRRTF